MNNINKSNTVNIPYNALVNVTTMNHMVEVQYTKHMNTKPTIKKLNDKEILVISTGEIKKVKKKTNRKQSPNSVTNTFKKLRGLINNNFEGLKNELFATLTYGENMTDPKKLYKDFEKFIKRLRYDYRNTSSIDYICVVEPQKRGAWHCHVLFRFNELSNIFIENSELRKLWSHGFVNVKRVYDVDNIGAYLTAFISDLEVMPGDKDYDSKKAIAKEVNGESKKFIKGGRLEMYPAGMKIFRPSKGITRPKSTKMKFKEVKNIVGDTKPHYQRTYYIDTGEFQNEISYLHYNLKRQAN